MCDLAAIIKAEKVETKYPREGIPSSGRKGLFLKAC